MVIQWTRSDDIALRARRPRAEGMDFSLTQNIIHEEYAYAYLEVIARMPDVNNTLRS
jgi:hypothetical protein